MSFRPTNSAGSNLEPSAAFMEKVERLSEALFPRWSTVCGILWKIDNMQKHRVGLLKFESPPSQPSDAMAEAMKDTSSLLEEVCNFRNGIEALVQSLMSQAKESELTINDMERTKVATKVAIVQQGGMLPPDDQYGSWEYDSDDDEGRGISYLGNLDVVIKAEKAKIGEIMDSINFEATIDKMIRMDMSEFAVKAKMTGMEFSDWNCDSDTLLYTNLPMAETFELMLRWFAKKFWQAVKEEDEEQGHVKKAIAEVEVKEIMALATMTLDKPSVPRCFTCKEYSHDGRDCTKVDISTPRCNTCQMMGHIDRECPKVDIVEENGLNEEGKYAHPANRGQGVDQNKPKFCTTCNKPGHADEFCPWNHLEEEEEEEENCCRYCGRYGHMVDGCWKLHPELRRVCLQKRKTQVCQNCRKSDHLSKYCPGGNSYKYGLRPVPER
ncbi:hypothetical protein IFR05_010587 [Cadophora sp. M221]|nr:hypothetical protein IFR05_010587 [Cadophora sp. M221]